MKAAVVVEPGKLEIRDIDPPHVGEYDALVEILGTALRTMRGDMIRPKRMMM